MISQTNITTARQCIVKPKVFIHAYWFKSLWIFFFDSLKMNITDCRRMNQVLFFTSIILFVLFLSLCRRTDRVPNPSQCSRRHIHFTSRLLLCKSQWHKLDAATEHTCKSYITKQLTSISSKLSHCRYLWWCLTFLISSLSHSFSLLFQLPLPQSHPTLLPLLLSLSLYLNCPPSVSHWLSPTILSLSPLSLLCIFLCSLSLSLSCIFLLQSPNMSLNTYDLNFKVPVYHWQISYCHIASCIKLSINQNGIFVVPV